MILIWLANQQFAAGLNEFVIDRWTTPSLSLAKKSLVHRGDNTGTPSDLDCLDLILISRSELIFFCSTCRRKFTFLPCVLLNSFPNENVQRSWKRSEAHGCCDQDKIRKAHIRSSQASRDRSRYYRSNDWKSLQAWKISREGEKNSFGWNVFCSKACDIDLPCSWSISPRFVADCLLLTQGGFAKCYELIDEATNKVYAGKIVSKSVLVKPHQKEKVKSCKDHL